MNKKLIREVRDIAKKRLDDERLVNDYNFYSTTKKKYDSFNDFFNKSENEDFIFSCYEFLSVVVFKKLLFCSIFLDALFFNYCLKSLSARY